MSNSNLPIQVLTVSFVLLLNFHSTFRGYPLAPHSTVKSSPSFFATVSPSLLSNHGLTGIMMIMIIKITMMIIMLMEMIMLMAILILLTTANDTNDMTTNHNNQ